MKKRTLIVLALLALFGGGSVSAEQRLIVRTETGLNGAVVIRSACLNAGCRVKAGLDGSVNSVFVVTVDDATLAAQPPSGGGLLGGLLGAVTKLLSVVANLLRQPGVEAVELDSFLEMRDKRASNDAPPAALFDKTEVEYHGATVRRGYLEQPAVRIIGLDDTRRAYGVTGTGVVAVIDTGVDPEHPVLRRVLLPGYDFVRDRDGADEKSDVSQSTAAMVDGNGQSNVNQSTAAMVDDQRPAFVNQSTAAMVDQSTAAMVDNPEFAAFGHGTMVAGVVHLVAPTAKILPLKAFKADGSGYGSDIIRAIYFAAQNGATVINMSFSFPGSSRELERACHYAARRGIILVASTGNDGHRTMVYPAGYGNVMGVASTSNRDYRSSFSNYGYSLVWVAAPGEGIVTTYPFGHYAATWGTSFSTPFVAGTAALLGEVKKLNEDQAENAVSNAKFVSLEMGKGRLDIFRAVQYWRLFSR